MTEQATNTADEAYRSPLIPGGKLLRGMIVRKLGGLWKVGHGADDGQDNKTDLPVGSMTRAEIAAHNKKVLDNSKGSSGN